MSEPSKEQKLRYVRMRLGDWRDDDGDIWAVLEAKPEIFRYGWRRYRGEDKPVERFVEADVSSIYNMMQHIVKDENSTLVHWRMRYVRKHLGQWRKTTQDQGTWEIKEFPNEQFSWGWYGVRDDDTLFSLDHAYQAVKDMLETGEFISETAQAISFVKWCEKPLTS